MGIFREKILEVLDMEKNPPEDEKQPTAAEREAVKAWIENAGRIDVRRSRKKDLHGDFGAHC